MDEQKLNCSEIVSIIVPVYNAENYIEKCLRSITGQTYECLDIIIVNDGSKDNSLEICRLFQQTDNRILIINNTENRGVGFSRNCGLKVAKGEYIIFVDSDDTIAPNYVEEMLRPVQSGKYDLAICQLADVYLNDNEIIVKKSYRPVPQHLTGVFLTDYHKLFPETVYLCGPVVKIYKKKIIDKYHISFPTDLSWGEDQAFNQSYYEFVNTCTFVTDTHYNYCHRNNKSLNSIHDERNLKERFLGIKRIKAFLEKRNFIFKERILGDHCFLIINDLVKLDNARDGYIDYKKRIKLLKDVSKSEWKGSNWKRDMVFFCIDKDFLIPVYIYFRLKRFFAKI